jgi:hypothetical protein
LHALDVLLLVAVRLDGFLAVARQLRLPVALAVLLLLQQVLLVVLLVVLVLLVVV